jgi:hypothetical protein
MRPAVSPAKAASEKLLMGSLMDFATEPPKDAVLMQNMLREKNVTLVSAESLPKSK